MTNFGEILGMKADAVGVELTPIDFVEVDVPENLRGPASVSLGNIGTKVSVQIVQTTPEVVEAIIKGVKDGSLSTREHILSLLADLSKK